MILRQKKTIILPFLLMSLIIIGGLPGLGWSSGAGPAPALGAEDLLAQGKMVYEANCARCHRAHGGGFADKYPALNKNPFVVADPGPVIATVFRGRKGEMGRMPAWKEKLSDSQVAAVITYIRHAWDNKAPAVTPAMVKGLRGK